MTFYTFMMRKYRNGEGPKHDLACDMWDDRETFPRNGAGKYDGWHQILRDYLARQNACSDCLETFEDAWEEYVKCEKKKSKNNS